MMKRLLLANIVISCSLLTVQSGNAKGCLEGAALGGAVGHMTHHTFLGIFGGCAGGSRLSTRKFGRSDRLVQKVTLECHFEH